MASSYLPFPPTWEQPYHQETVLALSLQDLITTLCSSVQNRLEGKPQAVRPPSILTTGLQKASEAPTTGTNGHLFFAESLGHLQSVNPWLRASASDTWG